MHLNTFNLTLRMSEVEVGLSIPKINESIKFKPKHLIRETDLIHISNINVKQSSFLNLLDIQ